MNLSIVIPVFNASAFISKCLSALSEYKFTDTEIIFVNDGSADDSLQQLHAFASGQPYVKVFTKSNGGAASARNLGIKEATGKYIAFLDADDTVDFNGLFSLLQFTIENKLDICAYQYNYITSKGMVINDSLKHPIAYNTIDTGLSFLIQGYQPSSICVFLLERNFIISNQLFFVEVITH
jgi:glycosyltransferase involved in cell wall biosynthesis